MPHSVEYWHSEECKLTPTLTFNLLTSSEMGDYTTCYVGPITHLPSLVMLRPVVFVLECTHIHIDRSTVLYIRT